MIIPQHFKIFGEKHTTKIVKRVDKDNSDGEFDPFKNVIKITSRLPKDKQEQTFCHEVVHCMLEHLGYTELSNDETFVDRMGKCLHQIWDSMEGEALPPTPVKRKKKKEEEEGQQPNVDK